MDCEILTPVKRHQYISYIVAVSFYWWRKPTV